MCRWSQAYLLTAQSIDWRQLSLDKGCLRDWILAIAQQHLLNGCPLIDLSCFCYNRMQEEVMGQRATQVRRCVQEGWQVHKVTRALMLHGICGADLHGCVPASSGRRLLARHQRQGALSPL